MKIQNFILATILATFTLIGCKKPNVEPVPPVKPTEVELKNPINDFTWKAMNSWYNWQKEVSNLADTKDDNKNSYHTYLNGFSKP